jgi:UDP-N-acetylglucosamine acyltransferase
MQNTPTQVHPSAVVHPRVELASGVVVGAFVVIEADVEVAEGTVLLPGTILHSGSRIGANCRLGPYAIVGGEPMDHLFRGEPSQTIIEEAVTLKDFVTVHRATGEGEKTQVGRGSLVMSYAHISHNVRVGEECVITTSSQLAGHCEVGSYAVLSTNTVVHQYCRVGSYAMFAATSAALQDILPFSMAGGSPAQHIRLNRVGLRRRNISSDRYRLIEKAFRALRQRDFETLEALAGTSEDAKAMREFQRSSKRGIARFWNGNQELRYPPSE